jgi:hypothetical protein
MQTTELRFQSFRPIFGRTRRDLMAVGYSNRSYLPFQVAVHDGEEDLQEEIDGIYEHREQIKPRLARHLVCGCPSFLREVSFCTIVDDMLGFDCDLKTQSLVACSWELSCA